MADFFHGSRVREKATPVTGGTTYSTSLPVFFGTAPMGPVNEPVRVSSKAEAAAVFGYSTDFESYTLHEAMESHFTLYKQRDAILVNVMDVSKAKKSNTATIDLSKQVTDTSILYPVLDTVTLKGAADLEKGKDYEVALNDEGYLVITIPAGSSVKLPANGLTLTCDMPDVSKVKSTDIIGGILEDTRTGLELLDVMMPLLGDVPKLVLAPKFSVDPAVADALASKAQNINGIFRAVTLIDIDTTASKTIIAAIDGKKVNDPGAYVCWPKVIHNGLQYHMSTHVAGIIGQMDANNGGIPTASPSNRQMVADGCVLADGTPMLLGFEQANKLNAQGITTAMRFVNGFVLWGNRTSAYPDNKDTKDNMLASKRTMHWINNFVITDTFQDVDRQVNRNFIQMIIDKISMKFNGLVSAGAILGGRIEYDPGENPEEDLMNGKVRFKLFVGLTPIAEGIEFTLQFDTNYLKALAS
ncbi:phage tail sheath subtilisin-like domain-containing protein [Paenibacillus thiaminolyticus]|uniref:phage tail sheath subtilisin-like domain-containing protein n=1 Tax=Paenibacillus thiaminolyticus TaxID=49283 RepID=UPI002542FBB3|nr:phage tail sheath subtilisin-like domain-containing protein [Paenibacillus thiaminolyticus]WII39193.1 phage tail sheath subtilisin-like domain-containing protein [Paenibacillus thiaminolyticus]